MELIRIVSIWVFAEIILDAGTAEGMTRGFSGERRILDSSPRNHR